MESETSTSLSTFLFSCKFQLLSYHTTRKHNALLAKDGSIVSLVVDGGGSFFLPSFVQKPKALNRLLLLEVAPFVVLNNGYGTGCYMWHYNEWSQDPNFVISMIWLELKRIFELQPHARVELFLQVRIEMLPRTVRGR